MRGHAKKIISAMRGWPLRERESQKERLRVKVREQA